jgi:hypothetical protein
MYEPTGGDRKTKIRADIGTVDIGMVKAYTRGCGVVMRRYVPGTLTPHVKGLSAEHISNKTLAAFNRKMDRKGRYALDGKSCALVGNSGLLKQTSYGRDIDNHDVIFRFNAAPTQVGAASDV